MNCVQEMKHCCWCVLLFFSHAFEFHFLNKGQQAKQRGCWVFLQRTLFAPSSKILCMLMVPFWCPGLELQLGPLPLPFIWRDTEENEVFFFFWGVLGCLLWNGSLLWAFVSSAPLVATAGARLAHVHSPAKSASLQEPGLGDPAGLNA